MNLQPNIATDKLEADPLFLTLGHLSSLQNISFQMMGTSKHEQL